ncbi:MAG TPA: NAD-dependent epimerase/dehydratase family protein [Pseudolabrys sp.]|nr:NAD-dependent epimerase/dehydratase family protein [Pseudolabrys sp.]
MKIFLAGAGGVVGRRLTPLLRAAGHDVVGTTRRAENAAAIAALGATPSVVDVFDAAALKRAMLAAAPQVVIHQLTDLPDSANIVQLGLALPRNARLREEGTRNLIAAACAVGAARLVAQSIAFIYADGPKPQLESDALVSGEGILPAAISARGVRSLESQVTGTPGIDGIVLRYGRLYGSGTWTEIAKGEAPLHVDAAAQAALLAVERGTPGIYNIAEDDGAVSVEKAKRELGFDAQFRIMT